MDSVSCNMLRTVLHHMGLGVHGQVVGVVAEEGEEVPVDSQLQGRLNKGAAKCLPPSLGRLQDTIMDCQSSIAVSLQLGIQCRTWEDRQVVILILISYVHACIACCMHCTNGGRTASYS